MLVQLTTTGRTTGLPRPMKIYIWPDGDDFVLVGSNGGSDSDPAWVGNIRATPTVTVKHGKLESTYRVREIHEPDDFARAWELVTTAFPNYRGYQRKTDRRIPLFMLEPATDAPA
jgi:deazaflavin-dependent oxidoreductase (nitroreductase family)